MTGANGSEGLAVDPQHVIDSLLQRVQQLTMENVMLQAALSQLQAEHQGGGCGADVPPMAPAEAS